MTQPLRRLHRGMASAMALAIPVVIAAGIMARQPAPGPASVPSELDFPKEEIRTLFAADDLVFESSESRRDAVRDLAAVDQCLDSRGRSRYVCRRSIRKCYGRRARLAVGHRNNLLKRQALAVYDDLDHTQNSKLTTTN